MSQGVSVQGVSVQGVSDREVCVLGVSVRGVHVRGVLSCHCLGRRRLLSQPSDWVRVEEGECSPTVGSE